MTDEKIKEAFEKWIDGSSCCTDNERRFYEQFNSDLHPISVGFYAGFRAAERIVAIDLLEDLLKVCDDYNRADSVQLEIKERLEELKKDGNE